MKKQIKHFLISLFAILFWIGVWHFAAKKVAISMILPSPKEVFLRLWDLMKTIGFYEILLSSFFRILIGFALGILLGFLLGYAAFYNRVVNALISPLMAIIRATPVASFILVVLFWFERESVSTFISFLMVLPLIWQNTILGLEKRDPLLSEMAEVFCLGKAKRFFRIDLPQVVSFTVSAGKTALGLGWKAGVAAEVLALPKHTVGYEIYNAKMYYETDLLLAWTIAIIAFSVILEKIFTAVLKGREKI